MDDDTAQQLTQSHAARAFEDLRGEVSLLRRAIEGLTTERQKAPDYSETLGSMVERLALISKSATAIACSPAMRLTPQNLTHEIVEASAAARAEDRKLLEQAQENLAGAVGRVDGVVARARIAQRQNRWLAGAAVSGMIAGTALWSIVPGIVARSVPASWQWPERIAARAMRTDMWSGAERLAHASDPERWRALIAIDRGGEPNRRAIAACLPRSSGEKRVNCTITVGRMTEQTAP